MQTFILSIAPVLGSLLGITTLIVSKQLKRREKLRLLWLATTEESKSETESHETITYNAASSRYGHMIDNVVLIVTGTLHERDVQELLEKCHPLGMFDR